MRKNFGAKAYTYPQPVFILAAYDKNGKPKKSIQREIFEWIVTIIAALAIAFVMALAVRAAPRLALRGFQRLSLKAGERRRISFRLAPRDLSFVTRDGIRQLTPGRYKLSVGSGQPGTGAAGQEAPLVLRRKTVVPR